MPYKFQMLVTLLLTVVYSTFAQKARWYQFDGMASLEVAYTNNTSPKLYKISSYKMFPEEYIDLTDTLPADSGRKTYHIPVTGPQKVTLTLPGIIIPVLLVPGADLVCIVDFSDVKNLKFQSTDSLAIVNNYLKEKKFRSPSPVKSKGSAAPTPANALTAYSTLADDTYQSEMLFYNAYKSKLPVWFQTYEYWDIRYADASSRMNTVVSREISNQKPELTPPGYYNFLDSLQVNNGAAKNIYSYYLFLYELFNKRLKEKKYADCQSVDWLPFHMCQAEMELSKDIQDLYKAWSIQLVFNQYKKEVAKEYITRNANIFADSVWLEKLKIHFRSKENFLAKNKPAPNFVLIDLTDSLTSLKSMKGNVVVLSFWFAGCKPCIEEFPFENELAEQFRDKKVKMINVCVNTTEENWRRYSKRFALKTINLWANPQWEKSVIEKYDLTEFPKYVLLDKNLNVAETSAERPSKGLRNQITALLNQ